MSTTSKVEMPSNETGNGTGMRSYASRRSLLDHHIPSSELDLRIMANDPEPTSEGVGNEKRNGGISASAPVSPTDGVSKDHRYAPLGIVIPTSSNGDGGIEKGDVMLQPLNRGPPRSALPDFAPPPLPAPKQPVNETTPLSPEPTSNAAYAQPGTHTQAPRSDPTPGPSGPPKYLLSTYMSEHPEAAVKDAIKERFPLPNPLVRLVKRFRVKHSVIEGMTKEEMDYWESQREVLMQKAGWKMQGTEGPGTEVTELYWKMYLSLMPTLERDPLSGLVPPDLIGSTGIVPLSVISLIPDIMAHYRDVIVRAEKEVFLVTNYWQPSNSVSTIVKALRDLSAAVVKSGRPKVVVKLMYDRGSWEQLWNSHAPVAPDKWSTIDLPREEEVPGLDLEVINFHRVLLGTFHAKFLVVDRKVALLNSNNIQDRPNLELMSHFEGPVVDAFYEIALQSWYNRLSPPLPFISTPYDPPRDEAGNIRYLFADRNPYFDDIEVVRAAKAARQLLKEQSKDTDLERDAERQQTFSEAVRRKIDQQRASFATWAPGEQLDMRAQQAMRDLREFRDKWSWNPSRAGSRAPSRRPSYSEPKTGLVDEDTTGLDSRIHEQSEARSSPTMVNGEVPMPRSKTYPEPNVHSTTAGEADPNQTHVAFVGLGDPNKPTRGPIKTDQERDDIAAIEGPSDPSKRVVPQSVLFTENGGIREGPAHVPDHIPTIVASPSTSMENLSTKPNEGELPPSGRQPEDQLNGTGKAVTDKRLQSLSAPGDGDKDQPRPSGESEYRPEGTGTKRMFQLSKRFNAGALSDAWATVPDSDELDNFRPHVVHAPHEPVPIAMCCRKPHGFPGHHDIRNPQNAAWLAGFRYAKKKVFVQSPTLNARPIVRAIKQTCRRGVEVILFLDLGFNDKGESIPFQGGTNEEVVDRLYKKLSKEKKEQYLKVYWYTGKDQVRPLNAVKKQRNCHIKFAAYDDQVLILGNGNQDSQSWFHSQEVNVMIDSAQLVAEMMDTLMSNQNTKKYGLVSPDGVWRDEAGKTLQDYGATGSDKFKGLSAIINIMKTI